MVWLKYKYIVALHSDAVTNITAPQKATFNRLVKDTNVSKLREQRRKITKSKSNQLN